jgi:hypothetical protein
MIMISSKPHEAAGHVLPCDMRNSTEFARQEWGHAARCYELNTERRIFRAAELMRGS